MGGADARIELIRDWLASELGWPRDSRLEPASADASFRRYFRVWRPQGGTRIIMDAPPDKEGTAPYLHVTRLLSACGVHVPEVEAADRARGLLLLEDLGATHMLAHLHGGAAPALLYGQALDTLALIQLHGASGARELPPYDAAALRREMQLLPDWFCARHLALVLDEEERALLADTFAFLEREALQQPVVLVHRDYHSRNLMITAERSPGVIDFQDAVAGPVGYDLVSLLKDCYIAWPRADVEAWLDGYRARLRAAGGLAGASRGEFLRWFDLIGLQRHLKVLGIFARLWYRDGKQGFLADLPRTLEHVRDAATRYGELRRFSDWVERRLVPGLGPANARVYAGPAVPA
ncbi:MAG TPA: phosphotransferase [Steroidobacteraceae bacterium]|nr:phosphotransferase [Steroidobacteraceae bacterium]